MEDVIEKLLLIGGFILIATLFLMALACCLFILAVIVRSAWTLLGV